MSEDTILAADGMPARASGPWAEDKLYYLRHYIEIFNGGQKNKWSNRAFVDLMAGPGRCRLRQDVKEFDGSPVLALKSSVPFTKVLLVEEDPALALALTTRCEALGLRPRPTVLTANCNDQAAIDAVRNCVDGRTLGFCFIDLLGLDVAFDTIRAITADRRLDLVVSFPEGGILRNAPMAQAAQARRWDAFFGTPNWRAVIDAATANTTPWPVGVALGRFYAEQLQRLGYHADFLPDPMKNTREVTLYRPLFASKHRRGSDYWKKISAVEPSGQRHLVY